MWTSWWRTTWRCSRSSGPTRYGGAAGGLGLQRAYQVPPALPGSGPAERAVPKGKQPGPPLPLSKPSGLSTGPGNSFPCLSIRRRGRFRTGRHCQCLVAGSASVWRHVPLREALSLCQWLVPNRTGGNESVEFGDGRAPRPRRGG